MSHHSEDLKELEGKPLSEADALEQVLEERRYQSKTSYLCKLETLAARPPKEEAIVLNSICLICGRVCGSDKSLCTI